MIVSKVLPKYIVSVNSGSERVYFGSQDIYFHPHSVWLIVLYPICCLIKLCYENLELWPVCLVF